jgi:hypothetical protein
MLTRDLMKLGSPIPPNTIGLTLLRTFDKPASGFLIRDTTPRPALPRAARGLVSSFVSPCLVTTSVTSKMSRFLYRSCVLHIVSILDRSTHASGFW